MKITKKKILEFFASKGFGTLELRKAMDAEQTQQLARDFKEEFGEELVSAISALNQPAATVDTELVSQVNSALEGAEGLFAENEGEPEGDESGQQAQTVATQTEKVVKLANTQQQTIKDLNKDVTAMAGKPEAPTPVKVAATDFKAVMLCGPGTNEKYLYGIPHEMFSMDKSWNQHAASRSNRTRKYEKAEEAALNAEFDAYGVELQKRYEQLSNNGQLEVLLSGNMDYSDMATELGNYYRVRRQDAIISHLYKLASLRDVFGVRSNVQDEEVAVNVFESRSYSQSYQSGRVFAGGFKFKPEKYKVADVMFKFKFTDLKELERQFIGYLNKSGSDPIKWGYIEWIMVKCGTIQHNEREERYVKGLQLDPTPGKPSYFMYGSDGILTTMDKKSFGEKPSIYVLDDFKTYTRATLVDFVWEMVREVFRTRGNLRGLSLFMNEMDVYDYLEGTRTKYGKDTDFQGEKLEIKNFIFNSIIRIPNMGINRKDIFLGPTDAFEILEDRPGEAFAYYFQRDLEELMVASYSKEGTNVFGGRRFDSKADMIKSRGKHSLVFRNFPVNTLAEDAVKADAFDNVMVQSVDNTAEKNFTGWDNAFEGDVYWFFCGGKVNATTVNKTEKFDGITANFVPTAVGDYLKVIYNPVADKYIEIERKVDGVVSVNEAAKAPEYVESFI